MFARACTGGECARACAGVCAESIPCERAAARKRRSERYCARADVVCTVLVRSCFRRYSRQGRQPSHSAEHTATAENGMWAALETAMQRWEVGWAQTASGYSRYEGLPRLHRAHMPRLHRAHMPRLHRAHMPRLHRAHMPRLHRAHMPADTRGRSDMHGACQPSRTQARRPWAAASAQPSTCHISQFHG
jgi:hypothetical protein